MGTSSSYGGPVGAGPLLPPWAPPAPSTATEEPPSAGTSEGQPAENQPVVENVPGTTQLPSDWRQPKVAMSRFARSGGIHTQRGRELLGRATSGFVRSHGGSRNAARAAVSGRATAQRLGGFLADVARDGLREAARRWTIDAYLGADAGTFLAALADAIGPAGALLEEDAAREALVETWEELFSGELLEPDADAQDGLETAPGMDAIERLTSAEASVVLERFVANYVYARIVQVLGERLIAAAPTEDHAVALQEEVRSFITGAISLSADRDLTAIDWHGAEGRVIVDRVFEAAYRLVLEAT